MLKKLLYLYNDGHNPFPHLKGDGFGFVPDPNHPDRMDLQYYADDDMTQEEADRLNGILPELEKEAGRERLAEIEELYPERFIPTVPTKQEYDFEKYSEEYEDEHPYEDYDEELEDINDQIKKIKILAKKNLGDEFKTIKEIEEKNKFIAKELDILNENVSEFKKNLVKLGMKRIKESKDKMDDAHDELSKSDIYEHVMSKISQKFVEMNDYEMNNEKIKN